jgi:hypothetical protein
MAKAKETLTQRQDRKIAQANRVWECSQRCTAFSFNLGCYEHVNGVGIYKEHGTYCAFGWRKHDGSRASGCFNSIPAARKFAQGR